MCYQPAFQCITSAICKLRFGRKYQNRVVSMGSRESLEVRSDEEVRPKKTNKINWNDLLSTQRVLVRLDYLTHSTLNKLEQDGTMANSIIIYNNFIHWLGLIYGKWGCVITVYYFMYLQQSPSQFRSACRILLAVYLSLLLLERRRLDFMLNAFFTAIRLLH